MKVKELIEKLQAFDPELIVVRPGYEGGVTEVGYATEKLLALNVNEEWYYGEHDEVEDTTTWPKHEHAHAVELS
jgi:hypothetical protein